MSRRSLLALLAVGAAVHLIAVFLWSAGAKAAEGAFPDPAIDIKGAGRQTAVLAGGCFWCTEAVFEPLAGIENVVSGYAGGTRESARYDLVSEGKTDHAEAIEITFDPGRISYGQLLKVFFSVAHDPTQLNRQGPDHGRQYRSAIFYKDTEQRRIADAYISQLQQAKIFDRQIVTQIRALEKFYPAEAYHQDFVKRNPRHPYVVVNAFPKLQKLRKDFGDKLAK
jgi:peptide-methionine (S)-S-oxide reductase